MDPGLDLNLAGISSRFRIHHFKKTETNPPIEWISKFSCGIYMEWNGMEWNGVEWSGVEWSGVDRTGLDWTGMEWNGMEWNGIE
ncbi:hypothetical protein HGM15179_003710 [Zosterops borbonicus]|uniref:Uncharacterized protein n=1 Tax=Zosterops borbonicus TaxID=364589 RepID=A0A8K1LRM4_9PASS|nr:hypothetical protein HGM15179_003710 [Zosterops borbonicus]